MVSFLQRLPLPRLVHFLDMILPQMVPVQSPCHSRRRRFASSYRVEERLASGEQGVEYHLNVIKLFWSRSDIMHVAIAWDNKPLLLLTTALLPNCTTESFHIRDCDNTRRVSPFRPDGPEPPLRCRRFAYGFALDGSEFPCYLVWPQRDGRSYVLLDTATTDTLVLDQ